MGAFQHLLGERDGRIDPVAVKAHVDIATAAPRDRQPVDEGLGRRAAQVAEHRAPRRHQPLASLKAAPSGFDPHPHVGIELVRRLIEPVREPASQRVHRVRDSRQRRFEGECRVDESRHRLLDRGLKTVA